LIAVNIAAFAVEIGHGAEASVVQFGVVPSRLVESVAEGAAAVPQLFTLFSSMFLHGGIMHLVGNLWFLHIFGDNVEDRMGRVGFSLFYLCCGLAAAIAQVLVSTGSDIPIVGASGAIAGVLGAYFRLFPGAQVMTLVPLGFFTRIMEIRAAWFLAFWFGVQVVSSLLGGGGVAWWAHIGGFVVGVLGSFLVGRDSPRASDSWSRSRRRR
jgi:membrane associated rhomboid family serine protease